MQVGKVEVEQQDVDRPRADDPERFLAAMSDADQREALDPLDVLGMGLGDQRLVLDNENVDVGHVPAPARVCIGSRTVKIAPPVGALLTCTVPWWRRTTWLTRAKPMPRPPVSVGTFVDQPLLRETSDALANTLDTAYTSGTVSVTLPPGPPLAFRKSGNTLLFSWPATNGYDLETTTGGLQSTWLPVTEVIVVGDQKIYPATIGGGEKYFRLKKQ